MLDHVLGRPSSKSRRLQVLAVIGFWSTILIRGHRHGPPYLNFLSKQLSRKLTLWQTVIITFLYIYAARNFSTLVGLASPEPLANMYTPAFFRATWILTALDAGFWTAMKIRTKWLRDLASLVFSIFYMISAEKADEKVRKVRGNLTVDHLRVSWNKGTTPYLQFFQSFLRPRFSRWQPRQVRIPRPSSSDYKEPVIGWLYFDGPLSELKSANINRIVLDIPGGGFVAMDPRCNDDRLWAWSAKTGLPILSLDYRKAPEFPYPYALNECFDVYTTLIETRGTCVSLSGTEMPRIVVCGDSAGGNLATAMTLMITESRSSPDCRFGGKTELPLPDGLILFYPGLDMNIGNWMSDEQMSLIKDRRMRTTNKDIIRRKSRQYNDLVGTPHDSDDEDETAAKLSPDGPDPSRGGSATPEEMRSPHPEYAHSAPTSFKNAQGPPSPGVRRESSTGTSHHPEPMRTRLAMSSMISYFNDRVLTPEMMRAMIILYVGPHNRPDFSRDYYLSPILAPDLLLAHFPKTYFLTGERDPLVDDTVIFSGRLRRVKAAYHASGGRRLDYTESDAQVEGFDEKDVAEVVLLPGTSHGFLQFPAIYPPAWKLIDRSAQWIEDAFHAADGRVRRGRQQHSQAVQHAVKTGAAAATAEPVPTASHVNGSSQSGRHHIRTESSGDEDKPLEMSMTRVRGRSFANGKGGGGGNEVTGRKEAPATSGGGGGGGGGGAKPQGENGDAAAAAVGTRNKKAAQKKRVRTRSSDDKLVKLASSDDLLSRRMQGLAGGLTGLAEE
ncbi:uncharacterized protein E0L32_009680 [Thyridium curvatum]|uniref:Alpha/beta hydrolase fold-3 domain-containing protein n=1 Tax=Thyridium curvatum TaxID=1093900 RepID=A0A507AI65_9PEZI|nr:uncharacterized protein E0L32_009680 [Thyridium curvatum]TPX08862.1 hypothetical protein E0L32_009680 [Thyridium curvatum]